jgi:PleD family two-component response regulator
MRNGKGRSIVIAPTAKPPPLVLMIYGADGGQYGSYLLDSGFRVAEARTREQGFDQAVALRPDLIVLDFGLDGELVGRLKDDAATKAIPIIALTEISKLRTHGAAGPGQSPPRSPP